MRKLLVLGFILLNVFSFSQRKSPHQQPKGKLFIIGGGDRPAFLIDRLVKESKLKEKEFVAIFPQASEQPDSSFIYASKQFKERNLIPVNFYFKKDEPVSVGKVDSLLQAKLIYFNGGDQSRFMEILNSNVKVKNAIIKAYQNGSIIAGTSAGAAVMSEKMITGNQLKQKKYKETFDSIESGNIEIAEGIGFLQSAVIDQHFMVRSRYNRLLTLVIENPKLIGIGIDEATAILVHQNMAEVIGNSQVVVIKLTSKKQVTNTGKLGSKNISLSIYTHGEKFKL